MEVTRRKGLSRARVLGAAVAFVDREGLEALSMRKLGAELGVEAMSLYNHVPNKDALLDGMVEVVLKELEIPTGDEGWEERVREGYRRFRGLAKSHPRVFPLLVNRPPRSPDGLWLFEAFLRTMEEAGFDPETSFHAFRVLTNYAFGYAMAEIRGFALEPGGTGEGAKELSAEEFPGIAALGTKLEDVDHDAEFEFGLDLILAGLKSKSR
ncbi:MAG: TetR/AcrR family transcriptional regulator C-terminal domain-containing protein [Rubrobacteraceae bacterium]